MTNSEIITAIKDVLTMIAAGIASYVAIVGLNTWRKQLEGTAEYEVAREVLRSVYKLRDSVVILQKYRRSYAEEYLIDLDKVFEKRPNPSNQEIEVIMQGEALRSRWPSVQEALSEFELASIEAEVLFGQDLRKKLDDCKNFVKQLATNSEVYYDYVERKDYGKAEDIGRHIFGYWEWREGMSEENMQGQFRKPPEFSIDGVTKALTPYLRKK